MRSWFVSGLLAVFLAAAAIPAHADRDAVQFFSNIDSSPDSPVHDAVCFFCNVRVEGELTGDIVVFFGNVRISGQTHRDVVNFFGSVHLADNASIGRDLVSIFSSARLGENATVGRDMVTIFGSQHIPASAHVGRDRVRLPAIIFWGPIFFLIAIIVLVVHEVRSRRDRWPVAGYPPPPMR